MTIAIEIRDDQRLRFDHRVQRRLDRSEGSVTAIEQNFDVVHRKWTATGDGVDSSPAVRSYLLSAVHLRGQVIDDFCLIECDGRAKQFDRCALSRPLNIRMRLRLRP